MAEVTAMRNNALPYPIYGLPYTIVYPMLDADGDLVTGATTPDAEISKNGDTFADCTNESTEIATSSGVYYLTLTGTELTTDIATVIAKSATAGMKTTVSVLYPRKLVTIRSGTCNDDGSGTADVVLDSGASAVDDFYNGMVISVVIDGASVPEVRLITDYVGSTKTATVHKDFTAAVDNTDTFTIYLPEGPQLHQANVTHAAEVAWGSGAITAGSIATDAIGAAELADGAITAATFAAGAIDATAIATGAIDADALAADAGTELGTAVWATATRTLSALDEDSTTLDLDATIRAAVGLASANLDTQLDALPTAAENADAVWDEDATAHQTGGTFGQAIGDPGADTNTIFKATVTDATGATVGVDVAAVLVDTGTDIPAQIDAVDNFVDTEVAAIKAKTDQLTFTTANRVDSQVYGVENDAITASAIAADAITSSELATSAVSEIVSAMLTTQMTEAYAANGVAPTLAQAMFAVHQMLMQFAINSTSITVKKLDNSTTAFTVTLDDATTPTSAVRT